MTQDTEGATETNTETATLGGGCFWCLEAAFEQLRGVDSVISGYAGGHVPEPTYAQVCGGATGHAEVVQLQFDPREIPFDDVLRAFFAIHDPTTVNRQGADVGTQYRSVVFYHTPEQKHATEAMIRELDAAGVWRAPIVTQVQPIDAFYPAEDHHQEYFRTNPDQAYCRMVIDPKVAKFRKALFERLKPEFQRAG